MKLTNLRMKICVMCTYWNDPVGGLNVKQKVNAPNFIYIRPERQTDVLQIFDENFKEELNLSISTMLKASN